MIEVQAENGKVNLRFKILGNPRRYRIRVTPAYARALSLRLQEAAEQAEKATETLAQTDRFVRLVEAFKRAWGGG